jgi:hypothetical protein
MQEVFKFNFQKQKRGLYFCVIFFTKTFTNTLTHFNSFIQSVMSIHHYRRIHHYNKSSKAKLFLILFQCILSFSNFGTLERTSSGTSRTMSRTISIISSIVPVATFTPTSFLADAFMLGGTYHTCNNNKITNWQSTEKCNASASRKRVGRRPKNRYDDFSYPSCSRSPLMYSSTVAAAGTRISLRMTSSSSTSVRRKSYEQQEDHEKFQSIRESAVIVEWEPVTELERRIDQGVYYDILQEEKKQCKNDDFSSCEQDEYQYDMDDNVTSSCSSSNDSTWRWRRKSSSSTTTSTGRNSRTSGRNNDIPSVAGVFCGYTTTKEEMSRLKSAHPQESNRHSMDDYDMWMI